MHHIQIHRHKWQWIFEKKKCVHSVALVFAGEIVNASTLCTLSAKFTWLHTYTFALDSLHRASVVCLIVAAVQIHHSYIRIVVYVAASFRFYVQISLECIAFFAVVQLRVSSVQLGIRSKQEKLLTQKRTQTELKSAHKKWSRKSIGRGVYMWR